MKRLLLGTSALAAAAALAVGPAASREASRGDYIAQWFGLQDRDGNSADRIDAETVLDNGIKVGYRITLGGDASAERIDESYLVVSGSFGELVFRSERIADHRTRLRPRNFALARDTASTRTRFMAYLDGAEGDCDDDKHLAYFTPRFSGFQLGASYAANCSDSDPATLGAADGIENMVSLDASYSRRLDGLDISLSAGYRLAEGSAGESAEDRNALGLGARFAIGGFTLGGYYGSALDTYRDPAGASGNDGDKIGVAVSYATGPWGLSMTYLRGDRSIEAGDETDAIHLGARYRLGPGIDLSGTLGWSDRQSGSSTAGEPDDDGWFVVGGMKVSF